MNTICPLCNHSSEVFFTTKKRTWHQCTHCRGIFMDRENHPETHIEQSRYETHNNDVEDIRYQDFVRPVTDKVLEHFNTHHQGLDFGAGTGPVITKVLKDKGYSIVPYDPFFHNYPHLLTQKYDYIVCCEVMEHFHQPDREFAMLKDMLNPGGKLICMTSIYDDSIDFNNWYYKNDVTHVFFYTLPTLKYIEQQFGFTAFENIGNLITFNC